MKHQHIANELAAIFFPWRRARIVEQVAGEVARQCHAELWQQVRDHTLGMSAAEARGYIRARSGQCLAAEVDPALRRRALDAGLHGRVLASATRQVVGLVLRDVLSGDLLVGARTRAA